MDNDRKICVGMIMSAHGVRGLVKLRSFTENPESLLEYKKLTDETGKEYTFKIKSAAKDFYIAEVEGLKNKEEVDALRSTKLYVTRSALPKTKKTEYYESDLLGLRAAGKDGKDFGTVRAVHNYGGGPFLEIGTHKADSFMLPFTDACVPNLDMKAGLVTIEPPEGWLKDEKPVGDVDSHDPKNKAKK